MDVRTVLTGIDDAVVVGGIGLLIARQFSWRRLRPDRLLALPPWMIGAGLVWLLWDVLDGTPVTGFDVALLAGEVLLVSAAGLAMGTCTQFRGRDGELDYRLTRMGILLWLVFVAVRSLSWYLAYRDGGHLLGTTAVILLGYGANRLAAALVIRSRLDELRAEDRGKSSLPAH